MLYHSTRPSMEEWCPIWLVTVRKKRSILPLVWGCWVPATMCLTPQAWRYFSNSPKPFFFPLALGPGVNGIELWAFVSDHRVRHTMDLHSVFEDFYAVPGSSILKHAVSHDLPGGVVLYRD